MQQMEGLRRYIEAGLALGQITRARAEEAVRGLIETGEIEGSKAQDWVENLVSANRERYEAFVSAVRNEVHSQLSDVGVTNVDELARRVASILDKGQAAARKAGSSAGSGAKSVSRRSASAKKASSTRSRAGSAAKRASAGSKKTAAKKSPAKKTTAKKTTARKSGAKKATGQASTKKVGTSKRASRGTSARRSSA